MLQINCSTLDPLRSDLRAAPLRGRVRCGRRRVLGRYALSVHIDLTTLVVNDYDSAIEFFVDTLGFDLAEDEPSLTNDGRPKRWVVVRPPGAPTGLLLARADGENQAAVVGQQTANRVGFFLRVDDFEVTYERMKTSGVQFVKDPRTEPYGRVAVFLDIAGNRWDLLGPGSTPEIGAR
ncbi:VOC family protein [Solicola gregarius]|uniref:VOC family protein n=1 Tax=Solicola gregarius TaxID=2908642 RepID=A0AA46TEM3_9ACTN|nr:VOC family protein [Solicola gregarius]UYM03454.1 VOC family protein [Solicola gregarius]